MARTLTSGATTWKAGHGYGYDWLVESSDLGIHWSFDEESAGGFTWEHRILSISEIEQALPPGGGLASAMTVTITVAVDNTGQCPCLLWTTYGKLDGADLSVSLLPAGEAYADKITIFTGTIDSFQWTTGADGGIGTLVASGKSLIPSDVLLPSTLVTTEEFTDAPTQSVGVALPLFYGNFTGNLPYILVNSAAREYRCAGHGIFKMNAGHTVFTADGLRAFNVNSGGVASAANASLVLDKALTEYEHSAGLTVVSVSRETNVTSSENIIDSDSSTVAIVSPSSLDSTGDGYGQLGVKATVTGSITGMNTATVTITQHKRVTGGATTVTAAYSLRVLDAGDNVLRDDFIVTQEYRHVANPRDASFRLTPLQISEESVTLELLATVINEGGVAASASDAWQIGEMDINPFYQVQDTLQPIYTGTGFQGRTDPDGTITASTAGNPITRMSDVLRSIFVELLAADVDDTTFTSARAVQSSSLNDWSLDVGIGAGGWYLQRTDAAKLLDDLALQSLSYLFDAGDGTIKIRTYDSTVSSVYDFTITDIVSLRIELSQPELITNSFEVRAGWDAPSQTFTQYYYANPSGSNHTVAATKSTLIDKCADSYVRYGDRRHLIVDAYGLNRSGHGVDLLAHLVNYFWTQLVTIDFETTFIAIHLEVGDMITVTHPEMTTNENGQTFEIVRITHIPEVQGSRPAPIRIRAIRPQRIEITYFAINDQDDVTWYWWVGPDNTLWWDTTAPTSVVTRFATDLALSPTPYWLEIDDPSATTRYVYPITTGEPTVEVSAPASGTGYTGSPTLRGVPWPPQDWQIAVTTSLEVDLTEV